MRSNIIIVAILFVLGIQSCQMEPPKKATLLIEKALSQKIESFKESKRKECYETIYTDAEILVDSIIAQQLNLDTIDFPNKPIKPNSPRIKDIPEEFELAPIK